MTMVSMKMTAEEAKESGCCYPEGSSPPEYPWGLEINLEDGSLTKLGLSAPPNVGTEMVITCKVTVVSSSQRQRQGEDTKMSSCWQITDMDVAPAQRDMNQMAKAMYPNQE